MAWYLDVGDNCCYADHEVKAWRWWKNGIVAFDKWAKEHNMHCEHRQDKGVDEIIFYDNYADEYVIFKAMDEDLVLIYNPRIEETGCFPFTVESVEDFHKKYLGMMDLMKNGNGMKKVLRILVFGRKNTIFNFLGTLGTKKNMKTF